MLSNPAYYGVIKYNDEYHEAKHEPIISKKLFDQCQAVLANRSRPKKLKGAFVFRDLITCAECGCAITAETQKGHVYYRCTKKRIACSQKYVREELLASQISKEIEKVSLAPVWAEQLLTKLTEDEREAAHTGAAFVQTLKSQIEDCSAKLDRLLDTHLDGTVSKDDYLAKKQSILNLKMDLQEKLKEFGRKGNDWLEPMRSFVLDAQQAVIIASGENLGEKKNFLRRIGSNPQLGGRVLSLSFKNPFQILAKFNSALRSNTAGIQDSTVWLRV